MSKREDFAMRISALAGILIIAAIVIGIPTVFGETVLFINIPSFLICTGITFGLGLLSFALADMARVRDVVCMSILLKHHKHATERDREVLSGLITYLYARGL